MAQRNFSTQNSIYALRVRGFRGNKWMFRTIRAERGLPQEGADG